MPVTLATRRLFAALLACLAALLAAQPALARENNMAAELVADATPAAGETLTLAIRFVPRSAEWHGYWRNPGDAGYGMQLDWDLPAGWRAGEPHYPVPHGLVIGGLMNHVFEGPYAILVPIEIPAGADVAAAGPLAVDAQWLACTDKICVPEQARLTLDPRAISDSAERARQFDAWRAAIPPLLDRTATFATDAQALEIAVPLPATLALGEPHVFVAQTDVVDYAGTQEFRRKGDLLIARIPLAEAARVPAQIDGIVAFDRHDGVRFAAAPGSVPDGGAVVGAGASAGEGLLWLAIGALAGGLLLNVMPCVFPILSLKALSLARAGESEAQARREGLAYTAGAMLACLALGGVMLGLRAAGENVGWAFQLQEPAVVVTLFVLAAAITANFAGLFELPSIPLTRSGEPAGAFVTGLLAAFVATPCTGPFMAAALGAALVLPTIEALVLFAALGLGLALPFLVIGFVPAVRRVLPRPGRWMETFRKAMAVPMGLTALALLWLCWRLGGEGFAILALGLAGLAVLALALVWDGGSDKRNRASLLAALMVAGVMIAGATQLYAPPPREGEQTMLRASAFSQSALAAARAARKPVFVWFTADWCLTCKVNESVAIEREATRDAFEQAGVIALRGDWTRRDPAITRFLEDHGAAGVPFYLWYDVDGEARQLPQVLTPESLVTLARKSSGSSRRGAVPGTRRSPVQEGGSD